MRQDVRLFPYGPEGKRDEPRTGRRVHLDLVPTDRTRDDETEWLKGLGATEYEDHRKPDGTGWMTMADPRANSLASSAAPPSGRLPEHERVGSESRRGGLVHLQKLE